MHILRHHSQGFTLVELLVVVGMIAFIATFLITGFRNYASFQQYNQAVNGVSYTLEQARTKARSAESDASHGVKFTTTDITSFVGDAYVNGDPQNETVTYTLVTLQFELTGGVDEIVFNKLTGLPSATGTVVVSGTDFSASSTIKITETGVIQ